MAGYSVGQNTVYVRMQYRICYKEGHYTVYGRIQFRTGYSVGHYTVQAAKYLAIM